MPDAAKQVPATFFPGGMDPNERYRFEYMSPGRTFGANGHLEVSAAGIGWTPSNHLFHHFEPWVIPWDEINSVEAVPGSFRYVAANLRLATNRGIVDFWIANIDADDVLATAKVYLQPGDDSEET